MMEVRPITSEELSSAIDLKVRCWQEELAGIMDHELSFAQELSFFAEWAESEKEYEDRRILLGAFQNGKLLGAAFGSFAELEDAENAMELNGLWVEEEYRGKGISLSLLKALIREYLDLGRDKMVVYSHHFAPSNQYYRKLHGEMIRQEKQLDGQLLVDVFLHPLNLLDRKLSEMVLKHGEEIDEP
ncbi:GNAT family N-acetyltransferase [Proteiniclasticum sp. SCR006]|uniref:GNAT family N-acetyltransferase n=1 Tax=Proteiniclasticum aestuarii TaxID=2817862 RepID=A0A939HCD9_9CLOT|nr:GNAT family N-acetyltransferase [Proteiniclasticum aestuarii]MBO1265387.1 GNAT family N-acetyltransferase [Proteiniclasticum aestuarii]